MRALPFLAAWVIAIIGCDRSSGSAGKDVAALTEANPPALDGAMAPNVARSSRGAIATWIEPTSKSGHRIRFASFGAGGWSAPHTIAESDRIVANWADVPSVVEQANGTLVAHWAEKSAPDTYAYDVTLASSSDGGQTWQPLGKAHRDATATEHGFVSLVPQRDRTLAIWLDGRETAAGGPMTLRAADIARDGVSNETVVDDQVCDCCSTAAAATAEGPVVVYRNRTSDELRDPSIAIQRGGTWSNHAINADGWKISGCPVNGPAVDALANDVVVAWFTYAEQTARVRVAFSRDAGQTFSAPIDVDVPRGTRAPIGRVDVVRDGEDAIVSWLASNREAGEVLVRRVGRDGRLGDELTIARVAAGRDSGFPKLTSLADGNALVAWTDASEPSHVRATRLARNSIPPLARPSPVAAQKPAAPALGATAPAYQAENVAGEVVTLQALRGSPVLLNVWATWCEPCRHELPVLGKLHSRYASRGLRIIAVNVDHDASRADVLSFIKRRTLPLEFWLDAADRVSAAFGIATLPVTLLVDANGKVIWRRDGAITDDDPEVDAAVERALATPR